MSEARPLADIRRVAMRALIPPPKIDLRKWIESTLRLPSVVSPQPGLIRLWPYQRGIADAIGDPSIERVSWIKSVRTGNTTLINAALANYVVNDPANILFVLPTDDDCKDAVKNNIDPMFEATPELRGVLHDETEGDRNTILTRRFPGGLLKIRSARSPRNLSGHNMRILFLDEVDRFDVTSEGDAITLAEKRIFAAHDSKIVMGSTPVAEDTSNILRSYETSDKRVYEVPCPHCGAMFELMWEHIKWRDRDPATAHAECPHCEAEIGESHKPWMSENGEWRATAPDVQGHAGFRINALISTLPKAGWSVLVKQWLEAHKNPEELKVFVNTILGQAWKEAADELDENELAARAEPISLDAIPAEVLVLTSGTDVQRDRLETTILGWTADSEILVLGHVFNYGAPSTNEPWEELDDLLRKTWKHPHGGLLKIDAAAIDAGDGETMDSVLGFTRSRFGRRVVAIKGADGQRPAIEASKSRGGKLFIVGVDTLKAQLLARLNKRGNVRFCDQLGAEWFTQLASERRILRYRFGRPIAQFERITGRRAEALDCVVYAMAARQLVNADPLRRENELRQIQQAPAVPAVIRSAWMDGGRG